MAEIEGQVKDEELDPEQQARRRLALAQIRQYPDAALKMAARPVEEFDDDLRQLVERMKQLMVDASGIGLAATQVGVLQRLFVFQVAEDETVASRTRRSSSAARRPRSRTRAASRSRACSCPSSGRPRSRSPGRTSTGPTSGYELEEPYSRVAQHESDHLDGVLILDRTTPEARREALASLRPRLVIG